jgi:hypothetical protein
MSKQFYVVNAGRFGGTSRATHIMHSSSPSTPNPRSAEGVIAQLLWFGGNAKTTLCGLQATRHVDAFQPAEASCRECHRRWEQMQAPVRAEISEGLTQLALDVDAVIAEGNLTALVTLRRSMEALAGRLRAKAGTRLRQETRELDRLIARVAAAEAAGTASVTHELASLERETAELAERSREQARANPSAETITGAQVFAGMTELGRDPGQSDSEIARKVGISEKAARNLRQVYLENPDLQEHYGPPDGAANGR